MKGRIFWGIIAVVLASGCLGGCIPSVQLNERAIVQAIGVDSSEEGYRVTLQIFSPGGGENGIDVSKQNAKLITADGKTISDAIRTATLKQGKQIFYGHNRLLIIGKQVAQDGIQDVLPFFNNGYESRPSTNVMVAEAAAEEILAANIEQGIVPAESLQNMVENHTENAGVIKTRLIDIIEAVYDPSRSVAIPTVRLIEDKDDGESSDENGVETTHAVMMDGTAVLKNNRLVGMLTEDETRGLSFLTDKVTRTLVVFEYGDSKGSGMISIDVYESNTRTEIAEEQGKAVLRASVKAKGRFNEVGLEERFFKEEDFKALEQQAELLVGKECEAVFAKAAQEYKSDIFSYGKLLMNRDKDLWFGLKAQWPDAVADIKLEVSVYLDLDRTGS